MKIARSVLCLAAVLAILPGLVHMFKYDGGAHSIAGINSPDECEALLLWAFNTFGKLQVQLGSIVFYIALFERRQLVINLSTFLVITSAIGVVMDWGFEYRTVPSDTAPGRFKALVNLTLYIVAGVAAYMSKTKAKRQ